MSSSPIRLIACSDVALVHSWFVYGVSFVWFAKAHTLDLSPPACHIDFNALCTCIAHDESYGDVPLTLPFSVSLNVPHVVSLSILRRYYAWPNNHNSGHDSFYDGLHRWGLMPWLPYDVNVRPAWCVLPLFHYCTRLRGCDRCSHASRASRDGSLCATQFSTFDAVLTLIPHPPGTRCPH